MDTEQRKPDIQRLISPQFTMIPIAFYEFWVEKETTRILFYTQLACPRRYNRLSQSVKSLYSENFK